MTKNKYNVSLKLKDRALASTSEGITISDPSLPDNPIIYANSGFQQITGYRPDEVIGKNCRFLQGKATDETAKQQIRDAIENQHPTVVDILNYRKDGTQFWNRLSITPVRNNSGKLTNFIGIQSDITQRRKVENDLKKANQHIKQNLQMAGDIQKSLLPINLPQTNNANFAWKFLPCEELAGDTLNIVELDSDNIGIYVLDVSGHGVRSALLSFSLTQILTSEPETSCLFAFDKKTGNYEKSTPAQVLEKLNKKFPIDYDIGQYFTIIYGILNLPTGEFIFSSAGHPGPIVMKNDCKPEIIQTRSYPIGFSKSPSYQNQTINLKPSDRVLLYTDGTIECFNAKSQTFGIERLIATMDKNRELDLDGILNRLTERLENWSCHKAFSDDVTMLGFEICKDQNLMYHL